MAVPYLLVGEIPRLSQLCRKIWDMGWDVSGAQGRSAAPRYEAFGEDLRALDDRLQLLKIKLRMEEQGSLRMELWTVGSAIRDPKARMAAMKEYRPVRVGSGYSPAWKAPMASRTFVMKEHLQGCREEIMVRVNSLAQCLSYFSA